jgi:peroxiredoxin
MGRLYAMLAENYAQLGDDATITKLIKDFEQSPYYTAEQYAYSGGQGREVPLLVTRPVAKGAASIIVTVMERARRKATLGPGKMLPAEAACTDVLGRTIKLAELRGKVVLVDFFARGFARQPQLAQQMATAYQQYRKNGFEIVSINTEVGAPAGAVAAFAQSQGMSWIVALDHADLARKLAIFGDAANFLLDRNGVIVARDIHEANLLQSVKDALGVR